MAFQSNFILRENLKSKQNKSPPPSQSITLRLPKSNETPAENKCNQMDQIEDPDDVRDECFERMAEDDSEMEYVTVIVSNENQYENQVADLEYEIEQEFDEYHELGDADEEEVEEGEEEEEDEEKVIIEINEIDGETMNNGCSSEKRKSNQSIALDEKSVIVVENSDDKKTKMSLRTNRNRTRAKNAKHKSLTCNVCNKTLSNVSSMKYHMQLHSDATPFLCSECGQGFKTRNAYDGHMMTHLQTNPNECTFCGKTYRQSASLRSHMLTHTGEKVKKYLMKFNKVNTK